MLDGILTRLSDGNTEIAFERLIDKPAEKVWAALTDPVVLAKWLGEVDVELRIGGKYVIHFREMKAVMTGVITRLEPPHLLEYSWLENDEMPQSLLRWEITAEGSTCRLKLRHSFPPVRWKDLVSFLAGWHVFLDAIPRAANGMFVPHATEKERELDKLYRSKFPNWE